jgi:hypothetical protein
MRLASVARVSHLPEIDAHAALVAGHAVDRYARRYDGRVQTGDLE